MRAFDALRGAKKSSVSTMRLGGFCVRHAVRRSFLYDQLQKSEKNLEGEEERPIKDVAPVCGLVVGSAAPQRREGAAAHELTVV